MINIFKRRSAGEIAQQEQKDQSLERIINSVKKQSDALVDDIRSARERKMLRETLGGGQD